MCSITIASAVLSGLGTVAGFIQSQQQAKSQRQEAERQAQRLESEAQSEENARVLREEDRKDRQRRAIAQQKVAFGTQGSLIDSNITSSTAFEFAQEQFNDNQDVDRRINDLLASATNTRLSGENKATATTGTGFVNLIGGAGDLVNSDLSKSLFAPKTTTKKTT